MSGLGGRPGPTAETAPEHRGGVGHGPLAEPAIAVRAMSYRYPGGDWVLRDINLHVARGATLAIIGPNGGGKTTLLKVLLGLLEGYRGEVEVMGRSPREARACGDRIGWVAQRPTFRWSFPASLREVVEMGLLGRRGMLRGVAREARDYVAHLLEILEIDTLADRPIGELSGGQQQRALIARALAPRPRILMLDEPSVGVDAMGQERLRELLATVKREFGITLVLVSHDLRMVIASSPRIACLNRRLHFHDAPEELSAGVLQDIYHCTLEGLLPAACRHAPEAGGEP